MIRDADKGFRETATDFSREWSRSEEMKLSAEFLDNKIAQIERRIENNDLMTMLGAISTTLVRMTEVMQAVEKYLMENNALCGGMSMRLQDLNNTMGGMAQDIGTIKSGVEEMR